MCHARLSTISKIFSLVCRVDGALLHRASFSSLRDARTLLEWAVELDRTGDRSVCRLPSVDPIFLTLAIAQLGLVVIDAPYNADHWLLIAFVNMVAIGAAFRLWRNDGHVSQERLMEHLVPPAKLLFLVCYGFAALAKYNTDFLLSENSAARELLKYQIVRRP